jgi:hypothetical protein
MDRDLISYLFSPFEKQIYCNWFLILEILNFIAIFILFFIILYLGISYNEGLRFYLTQLPVVFIYVVFYFQSRLLYSMCVHSI